MITIDLEQSAQENFEKLGRLHHGDYNQVVNKLIKHSIKQIKHSMTVLELDFAYYEDKYSIKTPEFYALFEKGELGDEITDYFKWSGKYEFWLDFNNQLKELS